MNKWTCKIKFNYLYLNIFFTENPSYSNSKFYFKINKKKFIRKLSYQDGIPITSIKYKKYNVIIENPMKVNLSAILNTKKFDSIYKNNKKITDYIFSIKKKLLNNELY